MPSKLNLIAGAAFVSIIMYDNIQTKIKARKAADLFIETCQAFEETQRANEHQIIYLCHMLDQNNVPADEFDLIALHYNQ